MKKTKRVFFLLAFVCSLNTFATTYLTGRWAEEKAPSQLVAKYKNRDTKALVVVTMSTVCPMTARLIVRLNELQKQFYKSGVQFIALFPNANDDLAEISEFALDTGLIFPIYKEDPDEPWYAKLGMKVTPEVVVLDTRKGYDVKKKVYQGAVDDSLFAGGGTARAKNKYLADALTALLADKKPETAETAASGCRIVKEHHQDLGAYKNVTFYKDVLPIVQQKCQECHRDGETGGELFTTFYDYDSVASFSDTIRRRISDRVMPPWHARLGDKKKQEAFAYDARLTDEQLKTFIAWIDHGLKPGDPKDAPPKRVWPKPGEWRIGKPDLVLEMPEPYVVPKEKLDEYQYYRLRANFPEDRYIKAIEHKAGNTAVVHHMGAIVGPASAGDVSGSQALLKFYGLIGDKINKLGDYIPGDPFNARVYPEGQGLKLPANSDIVLEMHYTPTGKQEEEDVSSVGIIWAKEQPKQIVETRVFNRKDIRLRPHDMHYEMKNHYAFKTDVEIWALAPHMHYRGKDYILYKVKNPGTDKESREVVLKVPAYDFNWQRTYEFKKPVQLKAGDILLGVGHLDNSHYHPHNPDPAVLVKYGIKSEQEMFNLRVKFTRADFGDKDI